MQTWQLERGQKEKDLLCRCKLQLHVAGPLQAIVDRATTAKEAWAALHKEYIGSLQVRQPMLMSSLTQLSQGSLTLIQYIDKAKELRDEFEALEMKASLPLLCQRFITGLSDELRIACGPALHSILRDKTKGLDDLADELRSMALLLPQAYAAANVTRSTNRTPQKHRCTHCGKGGHTKDRCWQLHPELKEKAKKARQEKGRKQQNQKPNNQQAIVLVVGEEGFVSALQNLDKSSFWYDTMATHHVVFNEDLLTNRRPSSVSAVVLGGNEKHRVSCQGDLRVEGGPYSHDQPVLWPSVHQQGG
jgi:hypothetical protein